MQLCFDSLAYVKFNWILDYCMIWLVLCSKLMPSCNVVPPLKKASQKCHVFFTQRRKFPKLQMECDWWARTLFLLLSKLLFFLFRKKRRPSLLLEEDICSVTPFLSPYFRETSPQLYDIVHVYISNARAPLYTFWGAKPLKIYVFIVLSPGINSRLIILAALLTQFLRAK